MVPAYMNEINVHLENWQRLRRSLNSSLLSDVSISQRYLLYYVVYGFVLMLLARPFKTSGLASLEQRCIF